MKEIEDYKLLIGDLYNFNIMSAQLMKEGWIPIGKLHIINNTDSTNSISLLKEFVKYKSTSGNKGNSEINWDNYTLPSGISGT